MAASRVDVLHVYEDPGRQPGSHRVLVDGSWPRGLSREADDYDESMKEVAPRTELRRWYGHDLERFATLSRRYRNELEQPATKTAGQGLRKVARRRRFVLLIATRDVEHSGATVLQHVIEHSAR